MIVTEHGEGIRRLVFHQRRIWRWASFDPPFRNPGLGGSCIRKVLCISCGEPLGSADDPVDALLLAWRHRKIRRAPRL